MTQEERNIKSKTEIITATIEEFAEHGFENALLNRIYRDNNISKGKIYHYFHSKEELFCECVNYIFHKFCEHISCFNPDKETNIYENLHKYYVQVLDYWSERPTYYVVLNMSLNTFNKSIEEGIQNGKMEYIETVKNKLLEIISIENNNLSFSEDEKFAVIRAVNENIFSHKFSRIINLTLEKKFEKAEKLKLELMNFYDRLIQIFLYGILPR